MAYLTASAQVHVRDDLGRFMAACDAAATESVREAIAMGASLAEAFAPAGAFEDARGPKLKESIVPAMIDSRSGVVGSTSPHALPIEFGAGAHSIGAPGQILGSKEREFGPVRGPVQHPGNAAQPFLRPAIKAVQARLVDILRRNYP